MCLLTEATSILQYYLNWFISKEKTLQILFSLG